MNVVTKFSVLSSLTHELGNDNFITLSPRKKYLLVPQCEHYCPSGVVIQALTGIQAQDVSETTPIA